MNQLAKDLGKRIRSYRKAQKLSQEKLAERSGMHPTYIGQLERGEKNATIESVGKITAALHIPMSSLVENIEQNEDALHSYHAQIAYNLIVSLPPQKQKSIVDIIHMICDF